MKLAVLLVFVGMFGLILWRRLPVHIVALVAAGLVLLFSAVPFPVAVTKSISWDVLAIYLGYGVLAEALRIAGLPRAAADLLLPRVKNEKFALLALCGIAAALSSFMANPIVVIMLAPMAIEIAERLKRPLFPYLVGLAISSNVVTTVSMVADPPALILAMETGMRFLDFYWFKGRPGLGTLSVVGVFVALATLFWQFRHLNEPVVVGHRPPRLGPSSMSTGITAAAAVFAGLALAAAGLVGPALAILAAAGVWIAWRGSRSVAEGPGGAEEGSEAVLRLEAPALFVLSVIALSISPNGSPPGVLGFMRYQGWIGLALGLLALLNCGGDRTNAIKEIDWRSLLFLIGVFVVVDATNRVGLLNDFADIVLAVGGANPFVLLSVLTWVSVALSSFVDNVPYTMLMIPVCGHLSTAAGIDPWPLYFGMLVGTGIGGNITPVGATANVLACGILERKGTPVRLGAYLGLSLPFSVAAVLSVQILLLLFWL